MAELYLPTLHTFAMENEFTGSCGMLRFKVKPNVVKLSKKEVDFEQSTMFVEYWHGLFCYEKSRMEGSEVFPLTEEGRMAMHTWLTEKI